MQFISTSAEALHTGPGYAFRATGHSWLHLPETKVNRSVHCDIWGSISRQEEMSEDTYDELTVTKCAKLSAIEISSSPKHKV